MTSDSQRYDQVRPIYVGFTKKMHDLIETALTAQAIDFSQIESRTKTAESFAEKIRTKGKKYESPLNDVTDLCGLRVIAYYQEDLGPIEDALRREFMVDDGLSIDKSTELKANEFGYVSKHFIVSLRPERAGLIEWKSFSALRAEIQIRTVLQHAWAAVEHKLSYKRSDEIPGELQRRLFRLGALFELADEQFSEVRAQAGAIIAKSSAQIRAGDLDIALDLSSLDAFLAQEESLVAEIEEVFRESNWHIRSAEAAGDVRVSQDRSDFVRVAHRAGCQTVGDLKRLLTAPRPALQRIVSVLTRRAIEAAPPDEVDEGDGIGFAHGTIEDSITSLMLVRSADPAIVRDSPYVPAYVQVVLDSIEEINESLG